MSKKTLRKFIIFIFLTFSLFAAVFLLEQVQLIQKKAEGSPVEINFEATPQEPIKRIWENYSQGGEERASMLQPVESQIKQLKPKYIRIDHLFDYYDIVKKDSQGNNLFDFSVLDERVKEITDLGAIPFLSLSYFPRAFSSVITTMPTSLGGWQALVEKTIQRYSGKDEKNIDQVYYEVWNEPDLFGNMSAQTYFNLYRSSVLASTNCQSCNDFKIGGPAITNIRTKPSWMNSFLSSVASENLRLDFVSWHSYQMDPATLESEPGILKDLSGYQSLALLPELIISEWGSTPEMSSLHDSYFDASHAVAEVAAIKDAVDKLFAFELKDGPSPEKKQFWGRWGLLTNEAFGIVAKPRYYAFSYLNKLLKYRLSSVSSSLDAGFIGSTDGKESYTFIVTRTDRSNASRSIQVKLMKPLPGVYKVNLYRLDPSSDQSSPSSSEISTKEEILVYNFIASLNGVYVVEITRSSPSLIRAPGRSEKEGDFSAKVTSFIPPLVYFINPSDKINSVEINFWVKPNWSENDKSNRTLLANEDKNNNRMVAWVNTDQNGETLHFALTDADQTTKEATLPIAWKQNDWHHVIFSFDNQKSFLALKIDDRQSLVTLNPGREVNLGQDLYLGGNQTNENSAESLIDDLKITINNEEFYLNNFD